MIHYNTVFIFHKHLLWEIYYFLYLTFVHLYEFCPHIHIHSFFLNWTTTFFQNICLFFCLFDNLIILLNLLCRYSCTRKQQYISNCFCNNAKLLTYFNSCFDKKLYFFYNKTILLLIFTRKQPYRKDVFYALSITYAGSCQGLYLGWHPSERKI